MTIYEIDSDNFGNIKIKYKTICSKDGKCYWCPDYSYDL